MPDYVTVTYEVAVFTYYVEQLNKIVEAMEYASDAYWGNPERYQFKAMIDSFGFQTELAQDDERIVRSTFSVKLNGYIVPEVLQKDITALKKFSNKTKIIFSVEATDNQAFYEGRIDGDRIITADPARVRNTTFVNAGDGSGDTIGNVGNQEAQNRSTAIG
jgi:hypothetical protein